MALRNDRIVPTPRSDPLARFHNTGFPVEPPRSLDELIRRGAPLDAPARALGAELYEVLARAYGEKGDPARSKEAARVARLLRPR